MSTPITNFRWQVPGELATGGKPCLAEQIEWLCEQGIRAVVSLEMVSDSVAAAIRDAGMNHLSMPVADYEDAVYDPEIWGRFSRFVFANLYAGKPVLVHCNAGVRRSVRLVERYLQSRQTI